MTPLMVNREEMHSNTYYIVFPPYRHNNLTSTDKSKGGKMIRKGWVLSIHYLCYCVIYLIISLYNLYVYVIFNNGYM